MDEVVRSPRQRFLQQGDLYQDSPSLDPRRFSEFRNKEFAKNVLSKRRNTLGLDIDREVVEEQLVNCFGAFPRLAMTLHDEYERDVLVDILRMKHKTVKITRMTAMGFKYRTNQIEISSCI